jgi:hypothetical protein
VREGTETQRLGTSVELEKEMRKKDTEKRDNRRRNPPRERNT